MTFESEQGQLATALRAAAHHGLNEGIDNHFSVSVGDGSVFLVNRYGPHWSEISASDVILVDGDGRTIDGEGEGGVPALTIHCAIHRAHPDARVIFHTHMPHATAVSTLVEGFDDRLSQAALYFHGRVTSLPFRGFATDEEEGRRIADAVSGGADVVLMANHGVIVVAPSVAEAWQRLYFFERACQVQLLAFGAGRPVIRIAEEIATRTQAEWRTIEAECAEALFEAVGRYVAREEEQTLA